MQAEVGAQLKPVIERLDKLETRFDASDLTGANLSGVTWRQVTCPDGTLGQDHDSTCIDLTPAQ